MKSACGACHFTSHKPNVRVRSSLHVYILDSKAAEPVRVSRPPKRWPTGNASFDTLRSPILPSPSPHSARPPSLVPRPTPSAHPAWSLAPLAHPALAGEAKAASLLFESQTDKIWKYVFTRNQTGLHLHLALDYWLETKKKSFAFLADDHWLRTSGLRSPDWELPLEDSRLRTFGWGLLPEESVMRIPSWVLVADTWPRIPGWGPLTENSWLRTPGWVLLAENSWLRTADWGFLAEDSWLMLALEQWATKLPMQKLMFVTKKWPNYFCNNWCMRSGRQIYRCRIDVWADCQWATNLPVQQFMLEQ